VTGGTGVIDGFLTTFTQYIDSGFGLVRGDVRAPHDRCLRHVYPFSCHHRRGFASGGSACERPICGGNTVCPTNRVFELYEMA
jgi:hypothetical protein